MEAEIKRAKKWYWWLWLSPLLTIPTLLIIQGLAPVFYDFFVAPETLNRGLEDRVPVILAIIISSLWHLVLSAPIKEKRQPFVHWHGLQALALAGIRTAVPLAFAVGLGDEPFRAMLILVFIWFVGTYIGQYQAKNGRCSLAQWAGKGSDIAGYDDPKSPKITKEYKVQPHHPDYWVEIIRFSLKLEQRRKALA